MTKPVYETGIIITLKNQSMRKYNYIQNAAITILHWLPGPLHKKWLLYIRHKHFREMGTLKASMGNKQS